MKNQASKSHADCTAVFKPKQVRSEACARKSEGARNNPYLSKARPEEAWGREVHGGAIFAIQHRDLISDWLLFLSVFLGLGAFTGEREN